MQTKVYFLVNPGGSQVVLGNNCGCFGRISVYKVFVWCSLETTHSIVIPYIILSFPGSNKPFLFYYCRNVVLFACII